VTEDQRRRKRFERERRKKTVDIHAAQRDGSLRVVYRCRDAAESKRRTDRANRLIGVPFVSLPGVTDHSATAFTTSAGIPVPFEAVEMVFNDALLMDAISDYGKDGPLTYDTYEDDLHREVYAFAEKAYAGVPIPDAIRRPKPN